MEIRTYDSVKREISDNRGALLAIELEEKLASRYPVFSHSRFSLQGALLEQIPILYQISRENLRGRRILDVGCGSKTSVESRAIVFEPWLCRSLLELGAYPVGVDKGDNSEEVFESYKVDLNTRNPLSFLEQGSFDVVNLRGVFTSKWFEGKYSDQELISHLSGLVKPNGTLVYTQNF